MKLPEEFTVRMQELLGNKEYMEFIESYSIPRHYGLRVNTLKAGIKDFLKISPFDLERIPWTRDGFYYNGGESPGKHPHYHAGLYYIQEPSAMLPAEVLDAKPGERVLDLCAAPGGKTVQIAAGMEGRGILVANDISSDRVKALVKNIELCGVRNAIVTKDSPESLSRNFKGYFDRILVDAPCSGEGMFRKDEDAARSWGRYKCSKCALIQKDILEQADIMLKPGGHMVYSTCTFSPEEDEQTILHFLDTYGNYELIDIPGGNGIERGRPEWGGSRNEMTKAVRLWPHRVRGEGHFVALLRKSDGENAERHEPYADQKLKPVNLDMFYSFCKDNITWNFDGYFYTSGQSLYWLPEPLPNLSGIKVAKFGWYLGQVGEKRFEPSHSMVTALRKDQLAAALDMSSESEELGRYLKGETLILDGLKGYTAVCVEGYTLGWAKQTGQMLKNLYPKGWRKMQ